MIGLDTNVLLAWVLEDQPSQLPGEGPFRVNHIVLAELVWILRSTFKSRRDDITKIVTEILETKELCFSGKEIIRAALDDFINGKADFPDYMLMREHMAVGCETTLTFDKKAARHEGFTLLTTQAQ